jgi:hypothetical protein
MQCGHKSANSSVIPLGALGAGCSSGYSGSVQARLHSKLWVPDLNLYRNNLVAGLNIYKWILDFVKRKKITIMEMEIKVAQQMLELLPAKIDNVSAAIAKVR